MPCDYHLLPHEGIQSLSPYIPGKSAETVAEEMGITNITKLASNENPLGCSPKVHQALAELSSTKIAAYPVSNNMPLRHKIAQKIGVMADMITLGNGSDGLFPVLQTCFALHCDKHILTHDYAFIAYGIHAKTLGIPVVKTPLRPNWTVDIDAMIEACNEKTALIFLPNPNNPTGLPVDLDDIVRLLQNIPISTLLILDLAYYEYMSNWEQSNTLSLLTHYPNLIITRTFSKAYGLAGLRLGYTVSSAHIATLLHRVLPPFTVNIAAIVAAHAALDDDLFIQKTIENNNQGILQIKQGLHRLGLAQLDTAANFIMFDCGVDAMPIFQALLLHGVIVRPLHPYGLNRYLRVTMGTPQQNNCFLEHLTHLLDTKKE